MQIDTKYSDQFKDSVMLALLPTTTGWSTIELPHLTLVYVGEIVNLKESTQNDLAKVASDLALMNNPQTLEILSTEIFGEGDEKVDVLLLRPTPELIAMRQRVEEWNASSHPFTPHVTVGPVGSIMYKNNVPFDITFDRLALVWGKSQLVFSLT